MHQSNAIRVSTLTVLVAGAVILMPAGPTAHEIPSDVTVQAFVKPEGQRLRLLIRVPMMAMRDVQFPTQGPGYLIVSQADRALRDAAGLWLSDNMRVFENDTLLPAPRLVAVRASLPSNRSFETYEQAVAHMSAPPLSDNTDIVWNQALLDVLFEYPITAETSDFSIEPGFEWLGMRVVTVLRFLPPGGAIRAFQLIGNNGVVRLDPRWHQAAFRFIALGFDHILDGIDHLLFLACLVIPFRQIRPLVVVVTSFTVAHSVTLIASAAGLAPDALWFPAFVETLIALSIVYMAFENIVGPKLERRWLITFGFGLVHGFGFSFALGETLQFAGSHLLTSLLAFNVGVEIGQLFVLALLMPALALLFRYAVTPQMGNVLLSALVAHSGWHWMTERGSQLVQYQFQWPVLNLAFWASTMRWLMLILIVGGLLWMASGLVRAYAVGHHPREEATE